MMASATSTGAQRVPAWKRLGLKLKRPAAASQPAHDDTPPAVGHPSSTQHKSQSGKRNLEVPPATDTSLGGVKRPRRESLAGTRDAPLKAAKSVSIGDTRTKNSTTPSDAGSRSTKHSKANKKAHAAPVDIAPALEYLRLWKSSRDSWKFNKNHQSTLIKHVFDADGIPAADTDTLYAYIRDLKGFVRTRLREAAMEVRTKDAAARFAAGTGDLDAKQVSYEKLLTELLPRRQPGQKRKGFSEANYIATSPDADMMLRLVKRMRAEMILSELSDGEQTDDSRTTRSSETGTSRDSNTTLGGEKKVRLNDGTGKRRRKLRVNMDYSSSSESGSGGDSETSSDSSSEDESDEEAGAQSADWYESSSSSSSSSSADESDEDESDGEE